MATFTALYDACVLYPAPLRDLLMELAISDLFRARWSDMIHDEWIGHVLENRTDLRREQLERTRSLMNDNVRDCLVTGFEPLIDGLELPDPGDRHVLAAAIRAGADVIVTYNVKHFPVKLLKPLGLAAQHPDEFVVHLIDLAPGRVCAAVKTHRRRLRNPPKSVDEYFDCLARQQLSETVTRLREFAEVL